MLMIINMLNGVCDLLKLDFRESGGKWNEKSHLRFAYHCMKKLKVKS
jgi:hypothetical protein